MDLNIKGKTALVTGFSRGIGKSIADRLAEEGVRVFGICRSGGIDLSTPTGLSEAKRYIEQVKPNFLINNVGGVGRRPETRIENYQEAHDLNVKPMIELTLQGLRYLTRVITISSIYGKEAGLNPWFTMYKAAQIGFTKEMARRYKNTDKSFNVVCPGEIDVGKVPLEPHFGKPEDVAELVTFLCSDKAKHINGAVIAVDGGNSYSL